MTPDDYCQDKAVRNGSSLYYAFLFLSPEERRAINALYALRREVGDLVVQAGEESVARIKLAWWRAQIDEMVAGRPEHPVARALQPHLEPYGIARERLQDIVDGMEMDLDQSRYLDWAGLHRYCLQSAGTVAETSARILGHTDARTLDHAARLGAAVRFANIIRDVGADARRGRIYLPIDELQRFQVKAADILNGVHSERFEALMAFQAERARGLFREALATLPEADRRAQRPGLIMAALQHDLLSEIERDGWQVLQQRTSLTPLRKLWVAWKTWVGGGRGVLRRLGRAS